MHQGGRRARSPCAHQRRACWSVELGAFLSVELGAFVSVERGAFLFVERGGQGVVAHPRFHTFANSTSMRAPPPPVRSSGVRSCSEPRRRRRGAAVNRSFARRASGGRSQGSSRGCHDETSSTTLALPPAPLAALAVTASQYLFQGQNRRCIGTSQSGRPPKRTQRPPHLPWASPSARSGARLDTLCTYESSNAMIWPAASHFLVTPATVTVGCWCPTVERSVASVDLLIAAGVLSGRRGGGSCSARWHLIRRLVVPTCGGTLPPAASRSSATGPGASKNDGVPAGMQKRAAAAVLAVESRPSPCWLCATESATGAGGDHGTGKL
jgi:hypothetical protein